MGGQRAKIGEADTIRSYRDGRVLSQRQLVYKGYEGRLSGVQETMDWTGARLSSNFDRFIHHWRYTDKGLVAGWTAPYLPGAEDIFSYRNQYVREYWKGVQEDKTSPAIFVSDATYGAAGEPLQLTFQSASASAVQQFSRDIRHRPSQITFQRAGQNLWNTGAYQYDGAGNITGIGGQKFYYDKVGRLAHAEILPQARSPWVTVPDVVDYAYDLFGNMTSRDMTQGNPPAGLEFSHQYSRNRISDAGFGYDDSGNLTRLTGRLGSAQPVGALWDHQNRMTAFIEGELYSPSAKPAERYQYDATGHRLVRVGRDGIPVISLRDSEGRTLAEYLAKPGEALPHLNRNFIYGQGQLLVERVMADAPLKLMGNQPPTGSTNIPLTVVEGAGAPTYAVDVRTAAGPVSHLTGVTLDANNRFLLDQTNLAPGDTNWVRIKAEGDEGAVYSRAVRVVLNPDAVPGGENQIRAVSLSRNGTDLVVRWGLVAENGKKTRIYFKRSDNGAVALLTQVALNAGVRSFTLSAQGLSSPCGDFHLGQVGSDDVESPLTPALFFAGIDFGIGHEGGCIDDPPPTPEPPKWADYYHVRDHLGTLRLVTDISGYVQEAHDYEPFGLELVPPGESLGTLSTRKFTGHERDASTGLDYMMARYFPASMARFLSVDPGDSSQVERAQTWDRYTYGNNNPIILVDKDGESATVAGALIGGAIGGGMALLQGKSWREIGAAAAGGAVAGAMMGSVIDTGGASLGVMVAAGGLSGAAGGMVEDFLNGKPSTVQGVAKDAAGGAAGSALGATLGAAAENAGARIAAHEARTVPSAGSKVEGEMAQIESSGAKVKVNPKGAGQEGNVTLDFGGQGKINLRVETHPLTPGNAPVRHANVETVTKEAGKKVVKTTHKTE